MYTSLNHNRGCRERMMIAYSTALFRVSVCVLVLTVLIAANSDTVLAQQSPDLDKYFSQNIGLNQSQIAAIRNGQPVTKALPSRTPDEVFLFGAIYLLRGTRETEWQ